MSVITIDIIVGNLAEVTQFFDRIEVYRSTTGSSGMYTEVTDVAGPLPAIVDGSIAGPWALNGLTLTVAIDNGDPISVTFSGTDPMDLATVIAQINAVSADLASELPTNTGKLRLTSQTTGSGSVLQVTAGAAATALGLSTTKVDGKARRIRLISPTTIYKYMDLDGQDDFWYKTRFSSSTSPLTSDYSDPRQGNTGTVVPTSQQVKATIQLTDPIGRPIQDRKIIFILMTSFNVPTTSYWSIPGFDSRAEVFTNEAGYAEADLLKGATYRVFFEGTSFGREFVAPTSGDTFDLMTVIGTAPDPFDIKQSPPRPIKMS